MEQANFNLSESLLTMTEMQKAIYEVESFMSENYQFRRNILSGKTEFVPTAADSDKTWNIVTPEVVNSIVRHAKKEGIGGKSSPRKNIEEYIGSDAIKDFNPITSYLQSLPVWDGKNHVASLFERIPGMTSEQLSWCAVWLRSTVAHWLAMDSLHGNESVPVLIGEQGCGKSTFASRLLPEHLRTYYLDHINFANKFDCEMALTNNLIVNIDEFANMGPAQQGKLKQTLSKAKVNGRPIFGKVQDDRQRFASFIATTNDQQPLCDPTGSRRYICISIRKGQIIDNLTPINYEQLYAQVVHELQVDGIPYWFSNDDVHRIQQANLQFFHSDDMESMIKLCYSLPQNNEDGEWFTCKEVCQNISKCYPSIKNGNNVKIRIGQTLRYLGCSTKRTHKGTEYKLISIAS